MPGAGDANEASATRSLASLLSFLLIALVGRHPGAATFRAWNMAGHSRGILPILENSASQGSLYLPDNGLSEQRYN